MSQQNLYFLMHDDNTTLYANLNKRNSYTNTSAVEFVHHSSLSAVCLLDNVTHMVHLIFKPI